MAGNTPKAMRWTGRIISAIPVLMMAGVGTFMFFRFPEKITEGMTKYGYPAGVGKPLLLIEIACAILYAIPQTAVLGAILLTGYLGGAIAIQVRIGAPLFSTTLFPVYIALLLWGGLYFRDERVRALIPLRV